MNKFIEENFFYNATKPIHARVFFMIQIILRVLNMSVGCNTTQRCLYFYLR